MTALVTGASSGIGKMYATELAKQGYDLVCVSNQQEQLLLVGQELENEYKVKVHTLYMDLAAEDAPQQTFDFCQQNGIEIEVLINNAGVFFFNPLVDTDTKRVNLMLHLHVRTVTNMCKLFGAEMAKRGQGYILNMSSMSAWMAMPGIQVYNATKAYILNFSKSFHYEMKPCGVHVMAVCPGAVDTGLYGLSDYWRKVAVAIHVSMPPQKLVKKALKKLFKKSRKKYMPGAVNYLFVPFIKHLPDWAVYFAMNKIKVFCK